MFGPGIGFIFLTLAVSINAEICPVTNTPFSIATNCSSYYNCSTGLPVLSTCPSGKYWDCMNKVCSNTTYPACCFSDKTVNWTAMFPQPISLLSYSCLNNTSIKNNLAQCGYYYTCVNNVILNKYCGNYSSFNNLTLACEFNASCVPPTTTTQTTTPSTTTTSVASFQVCFNSSKTYPVWTNCRQYQQSTSSGLVTYTCPSGLYYNGFNKCCTTMNNTFIWTCGGDPNKPSYNNVSCSKAGSIAANPQRCDGYFECVQYGNNLIIQGNTCYNGQLFDLNSNSCISASSANSFPACTIANKYTKCVKNPGIVRRLFCGGWLRILFPKWGSRFYNSCLNIECRIFPGINT